MRPCASGRASSARPSNQISRRLPGAGDKWHLDEVEVKIAGQKHWLWRAVDQTGVVLDVLVQSRRDKKAAKRLLRKLLKKQCRAPRVMITDKLASYGAAKAEVMPSVEHRRHKGLVWSLRCQALHDVALLLFREMSCIPVQRPAPITPTRQVVLALNWLSLIVTIGGELARGRGFSRRNLVYGRSTWDRNHDAAMRIGSEAPRGGPNLLIGMEAMEGQRDTATSDRHRPSIEGLSRATEPFS